MEAGGTLFFKDSSVSTSCRFCVRNFTVVEARGADGVENEVKYIGEQAGRVAGGGELFAFCTPIVTLSRRLEL